jgi:alpha-L-fucosidase
VHLGDWLRVGGEAIYGTRRWHTNHEGPLVPTYDPRLDRQWRWTVVDKTPMVHYTRKAGAVYAIALAWPGKTLSLATPVPGPGTRVELLGVKGDLPWRSGQPGMVIEVPALSVSELPCQHAWVFKLSGLANLDSVR